MIGDINNSGFSINQKGNLSLRGVDIVELSNLSSERPLYVIDEEQIRQNIDEYKQMANNSFVDSSIIFRTEMMERLMRKKNAENWQRRLMPLSKMNSVSSSSGIKSAV